MILISNYKCVWIKPVPAPLNWVLKEDACRFLPHGFDIHQSCSVNTVLKEDAWEFLPHGFGIPQSCPVNTVLKEDVCEFSTRIRHTSNVAHGIRY